MFDSPIRKLVYLKQNQVENSFQYNLKNEDVLYFLHIPKTALQSNNKFTRLTFEVNQTINPHKQDPKDPTDRSLGVAFDNIRIFQQRIPLESNPKVI